MAAGSAANPGDLRGSGAAPAAVQRWYVVGASCLLGLALGTSPTLATLLTPITPDVFGITSLTVQLTVNVGQLVFVAFLLFGGALGDLFGRRRFLVVGSVGFVLAGILAASAP